jgi:hypothetical protein
MALQNILSASPKELSALGALGASQWVLYLIDLLELHRT